MKKLYGLDALRGAAILLVIASHFGSDYTGIALSVVLANAGVILFFFLSGFLMYASLSADNDLRRYFAHRAFRILPIYWLSIVLMIMAGEQPDLKTILSNVTFTAPLFGHERLLGVYWTLYIEVLFYALAPLIIYAGNAAIRLVPYALLLALICVHASRGLGAGAVFYLVFCFCGMQIAAWQHQRLTLFEVTASVFIASIAFPLLLPLPVYIAAVPILAALLLVLAISNYTQRLIILEWIGLISYSWYLLHGVLETWTLLVAAATLLASCVTYFAIEKPMIRTGRSVFKRR